MIILRFSDSLNFMAGYLKTSLAETQLQTKKFLRGDGQLVDIAYDGGDKARAALAQIIELRLLESEPYEPVGWTRCGHLRLSLSMLDEGRGMPRSRAR